MAPMCGCGENWGDDEKRQLKRELSAKCDDTTLSAHERAQSCIDWAKLDGTTILRLDNFGLTELPDTIGQVTSLKILGLSDNRLTDLPPSLANLRNLEILILMYNSF